jgi:hypothetical protein
MAMVNPAQTVRSYSQTFSVAIRKGQADAGLYADLAIAMMSDTVSVPESDCLKARKKELGALGLKAP